MTERSFEPEFRSLHFFFSLSLNKIKKSRRRKLVNLIDHEVIRFTKCCHVCWVDGKKGRWKIGRENKRGYISESRATVEFFLNRVKFVRFELE